MRALITGAAGMLGHALVPLLHTRNKYQIYASDKPEIRMNGLPATASFGQLDVSDKTLVDQYFSSVKPAIVYHLAAMTDLEECEDDPASAQSVNVEGTRNVVTAAVRHNTRIVYVSTAGVFDGTKTLYNEDATPNPINVYGRTKWLGEQITLNLDPKALVVRAGWMFGGGPGTDHKFVGMILRQIEAGETELNVVDDKTGSPTWTADLSKALIDLSFGPAYGVWHCAGRGGASRYGVACEIVKQLSRKDITVSAVPSDRFRDDYYAPRPQHEVLDLRSPGLMRPWQASLASYIRQEWLHRVGGWAKASSETMPVPAQ